MDGLNPATDAFAILTVCPNTQAVPVLRRLSTRYELFLWVIRHQYGNERMVTPEEEERLLRTLVSVAELEERVGADVRAAIFRDFILSNP